MAPNKVRVILLCEDSRQENLIRPVCVSRFGEVVRVRKPPAARGAASGWVVGQYPSEVRALRSRGAERVGLVVVVDGDNQGVKKRKRELAAALERAGLDPVGSKERIATCVPTWSIETWLLALAGIGPVDETQSYKRDWEKLSDSKKRARAAASAWRDGRCTIALPSFLDACAELDRLA